MNTGNRFFITGIGTDVGKTVVSAVFAQRFQAGYWKPVQSGSLAQSDSIEVAGLIDNHLRIYPERFRLQLAVSPHQAAEAEDLHIELSDFELPETEGPLIVEGAGGLFVPINDQNFVIELIQQLQLPVVLVVRDYLGCINHTLLSVQALQTAGIPVAYVVFNGAFNPATRAILVRHCPVGATIIELPEFACLNKNEIYKAAIALKKYPQYDPTRTDQAGPAS
jgi:dethiobiotin synthetase